MRVERKSADFKPVSITLETREEVICMRAIIDAATEKCGPDRIRQAMDSWGRSEESGKPQPKDAQEFGEHLRNCLEYT